MSVVCIVAIPKEDDHVWDISSEEVPHLTLLNLGDPDQFEGALHATNFLDHAAGQLPRFGLSVDRRGLLGPKEADVLFFRKSDWNYKTLCDFRNNLLTNPHIRQAYDATLQFDQWIPHLTLGWPDSPAHEDDRDWGIHWVDFDKIALWLGEFQGPTFQLEEMLYSQEVAMSAEDAGADFLAHFGVKGMKWGHRKNADGSSGTKRQQSRLRKVRSEASEDADAAGMAFGKLKRQGIHTLSNKELQTVITRMNLEQQFNRVAPQSTASKVTQFGAKFVGDVLIGVGKTQAIKIVGDQATKLVAAAMAAKK